MAWRNPTPTVDVVVVRPGTPEAVLLIRRRNPPPGWALPGGFVDEGERLAVAARREVMEETGLEVELDALLHVYSDPTRDPRKHTMSTVYVGRVERDAAPVAGDDAADVLWVEVDTLRDALDLPTPSLHGAPLAFDHATILADWLHFRATGQRPPVSR